MTDDLPPIDDDDDAFPASANTPGQAESRGAYARFQHWVEAVETEDGKAVDFPRVMAPNMPGKSILDSKPEWLRDYLALRSEGWTWRKAAYIAWAASPTLRRWPESQVELARLVLGLRSDRTIRKWHENDPTVAERIERMKIEPLLIHRRDVIDALVLVAKTADSKAFPDRKMFLEMTGDYKPKGQVALTNPNGGPLQIQAADQFEDLSDDQLDQLISNLQAAG